MNKKDIVWGLVAWAIMGAGCRVVLYFWEYALALVLGIIAWGIINNIIGGGYGIYRAWKRVGFKQMMINAEAAIKGFSAPFMGRNYIYLFGHKVTYVNKMIYPWRIKINEEAYLLKPDVNELLDIWGKSLGNPDEFLKNLKK